MYEHRRSRNANAKISTFPGNTKRGKYHCTIDLLFDWFGISCMATDNFCFYLQNRLIQTSQTAPLVFPDISLSAAQLRIF